MFEYFIYSYGNQILMVLLCAIFGTVGYSLRKIAKNQFADETKRAVAKYVVQFVEQVFTALHGPEKLQQALETARELLAKKGISFDASEMRVLIEAAVAEFNEAFKKPLSDGATAEAARRVEDSTNAAAELND